LSPNPSGASLGEPIRSSASALVRIPSKQVIWRNELEICDHPALKANTGIINGFAFKFKHEIGKRGLSSGAGFDWWQDIAASGSLGACGQEIGRIFLMDSWTKFDIDFERRCRD